MRSSYPCVLLHRIFKWRMRCLALLDLVVVVIEMAGCCFIAFELLPIAPLILLFLSLLFRIATVIKTKEGILTQRLAFLGCCAESKPPYTVLTILLNRSLARPLVRGVSRYIIFARAFVLSAIGMGVPAFGIYATIIMPLNSVVSTRTMATDYGFETGNLPGHAGPFSWSDISNISLSIVFDPGVIEINVFPTCLSDLNDFGGYPSTAATPGADTAMLTLRQPTRYPTKFLQDTADASPLSGIATFGGFLDLRQRHFCAVVRGQSRRPLSALGVVHIFQRRALVRRWHEDFPAIHTEGGPPGSQNAGIVAFIRERLVDLGEDPHASRQGENANDSQESARSSISANEGSLDAGEARPGYILDEMPLLDVDLGRDYVLSAKGA
ncbi:hypothetical protein B0H14DRAFT_2687709 [Mycena olivaceomarginata]|nr:hypothetical protein B0H14DRAFT_2687709 [Mycena olivaceomarginata]